MRSVLSLPRHVASHRLRIDVKMAALSPGFVVGSSSWLRQNEWFARLMPPTVPVAGVLLTCACRPVICFPPLPVPSL